MLDIVLAAADPIYRRQFVRIGKYVDRCLGKRTNEGKAWNGKNEKNRYSRDSTEKDL